MSLTKLLFTAIVSLVAISNIEAQNNGKPWGFATVSDEAGTAYALDGGMRAAQPKTIVLYATGNGKQDLNNITGAISQYDIIVLDGSKGDFVLSQGVGLTSLKNKTIVGRSNARLCTEFYLTADDIAYLNKQGLSGLSSTDQYTGTLPDGTTVTCDKRAFFTKKAMMELAYQKSGVYTLPNKAGIFHVKSCENMIFRNIQLIGPGAVDIDGSDLLTNEESKQIWVDHCTFVDSQDGALDSKRCDYSTYSWNKFYYTDRSYSHAYTCGCGWVDESTGMKLHLTFGYNEWGKGCNRRLPQCGSCYVHLVNNYHNCAGNSAGMTINDNCIALVEGNYAAAGVNLPQTGSGSNRVIYSRKNSFEGESNSTSVTVPYQYDIISHIYVAQTLGAKEHGAGATMDDAFMPGDQMTLAEGFGFYQDKCDVSVGFSASLPVKNLVGAEVSFSSSAPSIVTVDEVGNIKALAEGTATITATVNDPVLGNTTATIEVTAAKSESYASVKKWDFTKRSSESEAAMNDGDWSLSGTNYTYSNSVKEEELPGLLEAAGLKFTCTYEGQIVSYTNSLRINKQFTVLFPDCKKGDKLIMYFKSANSSAVRGFTQVTNLSTSGALTTDGNKATFEAMVTDDGPVTLTSGGGIYMYYFDLQREGTSGIKAINTESPSSAALYNIAGQRVTTTHRGLVISGGKKYVK